MEEQVIVGLSNEVLAKIDALAQKMGVTVEQIWPWLIKQQYVEAFYPLALFGIFSIALFPTYRFLKKIKWDDYELSVDQVIGIALGICVGIGFCVSAIAFIVEFKNIFNPQYWALKDLIGMIK